MIGMKFITQIDPWTMISAARNAANPVLARQGAYLRGIARRLIRRVKDPSRYSPPGSPPYTHRPAGQRGLKEGILFAVVPTAGPQGSTIIGPAASVVGEIGHTHEFGGVEEAKPSRLRKLNWKIEVGGHGPIRLTDDGKPVFGRLVSEAQVSRSVQLANDLVTWGAGQGWTLGKKRRTYPPRPFMGPALEIARERLPHFWESAIRAA